MSSLATTDLRASHRSAPWPRPLAVDASIGLHACAGAAALVLPGAELWSLGTVALNHAVLGAAGLLPRSSLLGPNLRRLPAMPELPDEPAAALSHRAAKDTRVALTFDDGPDPHLTPQVLDLLDAAHARATFFCIADRATAQPALVREIVARGHSVQNHSRSHRHHFSLLGRRGFEREIGAAQARLADLTGQLPHCFRAPAGLRNPLLDPVLHRLDLHLVSWTRRALDTIDGNTTRVLHRLTRRLAGGDILLLHDGQGRESAGGRPVVLEVLAPLLSVLRERGLSPVTLTEAVPRRHAARALP